MRFKVGMAILATVILTAILLSPTCYAQGNRPVRVDTSGQADQPNQEVPAGTVVGPANGQGNIGSFEPAKTPEAAPVQPATQAASPAPIQQVQSARVVSEGHQGHQAPYQHVKSWNPASVSFVEARDARTLGQAKAYTDDAGPANHPHNWGWLWWLLLLALLAGLGYLVWDWWRSRRRRHDVLNQVDGEAFGTEQEPAALAVTYDGVAVEILKGILRGKPGSPWVWAKPGERVELTARRGALLRFIIAVENKDHFPVPTDTILVRDELAYRIPHTPVGGGIWLGGQKLRDLTPEEMETLTSGQSIPVSRYIDEIPVGEAFCFKYDVRATGGEPTRVAGTPSTTDDGQPVAPQGPEFKLAEILAQREKRTRTEAEVALEAESEKSPATRPGKRTAKRAAEKPASTKPNLEPPVQPAPGEPAVEPARPAEETARPEAKVEVEKPKIESKAEIVDRIRKEVLRGDYRIPDDFRAHLEGLGTEAKIREAMETYYHTRGRLIGIDKAADRRADYRKISELAAKVAMGQMKAEEAESAYRPAESSITDTGSADEAKTGLLSGLTGGAS